MKTIITAIGLSLLLTSFPSQALSAKTLAVFACEPEWKSLAETLGGQHVSVFSATTAFQDPHFIEARPSLIAKTRQADLVVCTGAELEVGWLPLLLRQSGNATIQNGEPGFFLATEQVALIETPTELDRSHGDVHASGNPHVLWAPYRLLTIAKALSKRLITIDPANTKDYQENYRSFEVRWKTQISLWEEQAAILKGKKVIVYHKYWSYLNNWLEMEAAGDLEPKPGLPPTSAHLARLLDTSRSAKIDFILVANHQNDKGARWLSKKTQIPVINIPVTVGGSDKAKDLVSLYDEVITALVVGARGIQE